MLDPVKADCLNTVLQLYSDDSIHQGRRGREGVGVGWEECGWRGAWAWGGQGRGAEGPGGVKVMEADVLTTT